MKLEDKMFQTVVTAFQGIQAKELTDVYAISFFVCDHDDDPRRPTLSVGYNTLSHWKHSLAGASDSAEAKWNYAFWLQNAVTTFGAPGTASAKEVGEWVKANGLSYTDAEEDSDFDRSLALGEKITARFVGACCDVANRLHKEGVIRRVFSAEIPVIVHELEYYEEIATQNERCNPPSAIAEFATWVRSLS